MIKYLTYLLLLGLAACAGKEPPEPTRYEVPTSVAPYVARFVEEGQKRGVVVTLDNLIVSLQAQPPGGDDVCGAYFKPARPGGQRRITLVESSACWMGTYDQNREALVFHELAHCFLGREHRNDLLPNAAPASLMTTRLNGPYEPCAYPIDNTSDCDRRSRRDYYLDELFNAATGVPAWAR